MNEIEHTVVIAGAGPTGLALGAELMRLGITSLILDRLETGANTLRGFVCEIESDCTDSIRSKCSRKEAV